MLVNYKVEWCYKGQDTYQSYSNHENLLQALDFLIRLVANKTDYNYKEIVSVRIELNEFLWICIFKNFLGQEVYYLMCSDYDIGNLNSFKDVEILIKNIY